MHDTLNFEDIESYEHNVLVEEDPGIRIVELEEGGIPPLLILFIRLSSEARAVLKP